MLEEGTVRELDAKLKAANILVHEADGVIMAIPLESRTDLDMSQNDAAYQVMYAAWQAIADNDQNLLETALSLYTRNAELEDRVTAAEARAEAAEKQLAEVEPARDPRNVFADPTIGCANCGRPIVEAGRVITGGWPDGEWVCSDACDAELSELGCPHENSADYRPRFEDRQAEALAQAGAGGEGV